MSRSRTPDILDKRSGEDQCEFGQACWGYSLGEKARDRTCSDREWTCMRRRPDDVEGGKRAKAFSRVSGGAGNLSVYISRVHKFLYVQLQSEEVIKCQLFRSLTNLAPLGLDKSLFRISKSSEHSERML
jgi:hypothetical protein